MALSALNGSDPETVAKATARSRKSEILDAALACLTEGGYAGTTMLDVATRARTSKETLYKWFGTKSGLFTAMIDREATRLHRELCAGFRDDGADVRGQLERFARTYLRFAAHPTALALARAAIAESDDTPQLGRTLLARGRETSVPMVASVLRQWAERGDLILEDPQRAYEVLVGLVVGDVQFRLMMGQAKQPDEDWIRRRAVEAVDKFLMIYGA